MNFWPQKLTLWFSFWTQKLTLWFSFWGQKLSLWFSFWFKYFCSRILADRKRKNNLNRFWIIDEFNRNKKNPFEQKFFYFMNFWAQKLTLWFSFWTQKLTLWFSFWPQK